MNDFIMIMVSYLAIILISVLGINFLTKGLLMSIIKVKMSRGKKILIRCHDFVGVYFKTAQLKDKSIKFKNINNEPLQCTSIEPKFFYRHFGVNTVDYDVINSTLIKPDYKDVKGMYAGDVDSFVTRAYQLGQLASDQKKYLMIGAIAIVAVIAVGFYLTQDTIIQKVGEIVHNACAVGNV